MVASFNLVMRALSVAACLIGIPSFPIHAHAEDLSQTFNQHFLLPSLSLWNSEAASGKLTGGGELGYSPFDVTSQEDARQHGHGLLDMNLKGSLEGLGYGVEYFSLGQGYTKPAGSKLKPDQEGSQAWLESRAGPMRLKTLVTEYWDNVEGNPHRPRTIKSLMGPAVDLTLPSGVVWGLSYLEGSMQHVTPERSAFQRESRLQSYGSYVFYGRTLWDATISSQYLPSRDHNNSMKETIGSYHEISATVRPTSFLTVEPALSLSQEEYKWSGTRSETPSAMLSIIVKPLSSAYSLVSTGYYSRNITTDGYWDARTLSVSASVSRLFTGRTGPKALSFTVLYNRYDDVVYRDSSYRDIQGRVIWRMAKW